MISLLVSILSSIFLGGGVQPQPDDDGVIHGF